MEKFEDVFRGHYGHVFGFLLKLCGYDKDMAEELTQETFFEAYISLSNFRGSCRVETWLVGIAKNRFYTALRRRRLPAQSLEALPWEPAGPGGEMEDRLYRRELALRAREIIDSMRPNMRDAVLYRVFSDMPYAQIAGLMGITEGSAKVLYHRGRELLRKRLKEEYGYEI